MSPASFLNEASFPCVSCSEFLILTHNFHEMIVTVEKYESKVMFLECTVAVIRPRYSFWRFWNV
jgi:hypothetical protein